MKHFDTMKEAIEALPKARKAMGEHCIYNIEKMDTLTQGTFKIIACYDSQANFLGYY